MSVNAGNVVVAIKAVDECSSTFEKIQASMGVLGGTLSQLGGPFAGLGSIVSGFAAGGPAGAGIAALGQVTGFLTDSIAEAAKSEQAMTNLAAAVERGGTAWSTVKDGVEKALGSMQSMSKFSDEELAGALQTLITHGMDTKTALESLHTAMDTAVGSGRDLQTVSEAIGKAYEGQEGPLARIVPAIKDMKDSMGEGATKAELFQGALGALNERFSGAALADAETFAGTQERLKNAMSDLGEKIGDIVLPALAGITEAMIPFVDGLATGVGKVQDWISAVSKMPEVKEAVDATGQAFAGFQKYLSDTWDSVKDDFKPLMDELGKAFSELMEALKPIGEAFGELMGAFGGAGDSINPLKLLIDGFILLIRLWVFEFRGIIAVIKIFADAFKAAADFISPIISTLRETIGGFIDWLTKAFQGFYDWLVGGSLWIDLWNNLNSITSGAAATIISSIGASLFDPLTSGFTTTVDTLKTTFGEVVDAVSKPLSDITTKIHDEFPNMSSAITAGTDILKDDWSKGLKGLADAVPGAFAEVTTALSKALGDVGGQVNNWFAGAFKGLGQALSGVTGGKNPFAAVGDDAQNSVHGVSEAQQAMDAFGSSSNVATGYVTDLANEMQSQPEIFSAWASNFQAAGVQIDTTKAKIGDYVQAAAKVTQAYQQGKIDEEHFANMLGELGDAFDVTKLKTQGFVDGITAILTAGSEAWYAPILNFVNLVIGHSLWPEAWEAMVMEVETKGGDLIAAVSKIFGSIYDEMKDNLGDLQQIISRSFGLIYDEMKDNLGDMQQIISRSFGLIYDVVSSAIQDLKNVIVDAFTTGITILSAFTAEWQKLQTTLMDSIQIFSLIGMQMTVFATSVQAALTLIAAPLADLIDLVQTWSTSWSNLAATAQSSLALMKGQLKGFFDWLTPFWEASTAAFLGTATIWLETLNGQMRTRLNDMHSVWSSTLSSMAGDAASYFNSIVAQISAAVDRIIAKLSAARAQVSSHSIWPDMLNEMLTQTEDYMGQIEGAFAEGLQGGIVSSVAAAGSQVAATPMGGEGSFTSTSRQEITIPVTVMLDGDAIYRSVERRQVETLSREVGRSRRSIT